MANYSNLKAAINAVIKQNGQGEITGEVMNQVLTAMVNSLGSNYLFAGVATPSTNPGTPDQNVFYMATQAGTYTNFSAIVLQAGISILLWNGSWSSETFFGIDSVPTSGSDNFISSGAVFDKFKLDGGAYDVSAHNNNQTFASLSELLNDANLSTLIPTNIRRGGMSIKFVQSSDNKYVQYRLMNTSFSTEINDWEICISIEMVNEAIGKYVFTSSIFTDGYYWDMHNLVVGSNAPSVISDSPAKGYAQPIEVKSGSDITLHSYTTSGIAGYVRPIVIVSKETNLVVAIAPSATENDYLTTPFTYSCNEDVYLYLNCNTEHYSDFSLNIIGYCGLRIEKDVNELKNKINSADEVPTCCSDELTISNGVYRAISNSINKTYDSTIFTNGHYWDSYGYVVNGHAPSEIRDSPTKGYAQPIEVKANSIIILHSYTTSGISGHCKPIVIASKSTGLILELSPSATENDYIENPFTYTCEEDVYLYLNCNIDHYSDFFLEIKFDIAKELEEEAYSHNYLYRKVVVKHSPTIMALGASFTSPLNTWVEKMGTMLGATVNNLAVPSTNICDVAKKLKNGTITINTTDVVMIQHVHNYDVFTLPNTYKQMSVSEYETNVNIDSWSSTGYLNSPYIYAIAYDYVIKKLRSLMNANRTSTPYANNTYMGGNYPYQTQILLCTHWHDARTIFNQSVRKLCVKWCLPLLNFDELIGFSKDCLNFAGVQPSLEYVGQNSSDYVPTETIDGVVYGVHPSLGDTDIQWRMAAIGADKFIVLPNT